MTREQYYFAVNRAILAEAPRGHAPSFEDRCFRQALREWGWENGTSAQAMALQILLQEGVEQATYFISVADEERYL